MVPKVEENKSKGCKNKAQAVSELRDKIALLKNKKLKSSVGNVVVANNSTKLDSTINDPRFSNNIILCSFNKCESQDSERNQRPSVTGRTTTSVCVDRRSMMNIYRRKLNHYKTLIGILINARSKDLSRNIIRKTLRFLKEDDKIKSEKIRSRNEIENVKKNAVLINNKKKIDSLIPESQESIRFIGTKRTETLHKNCIASTSKDFENFDDESTLLVLSLEKNNEIGDSDATIPSNAKISDQNSRLFDKMGDKKLRKNTGIQKSLDPYEFEDSDVVISSYQEDERVTESSIVQGTAKTDSKIKKDTSSVVSEENKILSIGRKELCEKKILPARNHGRKSENEIIEVCVYDERAKGPKTNRKKGRILKESNKEESNNAGKLNQSELNVKAKPAGNYCRCERNKSSKYVKTTSYAVPAKIEYPALDIRKGNESYLAGVKSGPDVSEIDIISPIGEKKPKKFYSPLELEYSEVTKARLDPKHVSHDNKKNKVKAKRSKLGKRDSKVFNKFCLSNFTMSQNSAKNEDSDVQVISQNSNLLKCPTFSRYSIPVSIEINMTRNDFLRKLSGLNLIQSKITRYFRRIVKDHDYSKLNAGREKKSNFNSAGNNNCDENGNVTSSRSKSRLLPTIESDVVLKNSQKLIYSKNWAIQKPKLMSISHRDYLYGELNDSDTIKKTTSNRNITQNNSKSYDIIGKENTDDSNTSADVSVVPPSYSIFSDDDNSKSIINIDSVTMLDTQQKEDLLAPWETVDILEKINYWNDDTFDL